MSGPPLTACSTTLQYQGRTWWASRTATRQPTSRCRAALRMLCCAWRGFACLPALAPTSSASPRPSPACPCCPACPQVCGTAQYVDDIKLPADALFAAIVASTKPHAKIVKLDTTAAAAMPGVHGIFTAKDVPGGNDIGPVIKDEELFATVGGAGLVLGGGLPGAQQRVGSPPPRLHRAHAVPSCAFD